MDELLIIGDVLEELSKFPDNYIYLTITSPPYNKRGVGGRIVPKIEYDTYNDTMPEDEYQKWQINILNELWRITKHGGHLFYNHKTRYVNKIAIHPLEWILKSKWKLYEEIVWDRKITANLAQWRFHHYTEKIFWLRKEPMGKFKIPKESAKLGNVWRIMPKLRNRDHPAQFPEEIPERILKAVGKKEEFVLDPFLGTGTTLVVAKRLGFTKLI